MLHYKVYLWSERDFPSLTSIFSFSSSTGHAGLCAVKSYWATCPTLKFLISPIHTICVFNVHILGQTHMCLLITFHWIFNLLQRICTCVCTWEKGLCPTHLTAGFGEPLQVQSHSYPSIHVRMNEWGALLYIFHWNNAIASIYPVIIVHLGFSHNFAYSNTFILPVGSRFSYTAWNLLLVNSDFFPQPRKFPVQWMVEDIELLENAWSSGHGVVITTLSPLWDL